MSEKNKIMEAFLQGVAESVQRKQAEKQMAAKGSEGLSLMPQMNMPDPNAMTLVKPDEQTIEPKYIYWVWKIGSVGEVVATYFIKHSPEANRNAGDFIVDLEIEVERTMNASEAKSLGLVLISAHKWENDWQTHVGEYLAVQTSEPIEPQPPTEHVVRDDDGFVEDAG